MDTPDNPSTRASQEAVLLAADQGAEARLNSARAAWNGAELHAEAGDTTAAIKALSTLQVDTTPAGDLAVVEGEDTIPVSENAEATVEATVEATDSAAVEDSVTASSDESAKDKPLTAEERSIEINNLREKRKNGDFNKDDEAKLAGLEDDEIEAAAAEYDPSNPDSLVETAQKLQDISESRRGYAENKTMKETMARVFKEWVAERSNPEANLNAAEKAALKKVQELVGEMHKDLLTIINANKQIERVQKDVAVAIKETEAQEKKLHRLKDISKDDEAQQKEALQLQAMYVNLLNKKAQLLGAANAAHLANNSFRVKRTQVRRALGLTGFWTGLIESAGTRIRNSAGNGAANIDTFLRGKPLAEKYINKKL